MIAHQNTVPNIFTTEIPLMIKFTIPTTIKMILGNMMPNNNSSLQYLQSNRKHADTIERLRTAIADGDNSITLGDAVALHSNEELDTFFEDL
jgi:hypothetical protein